MTGTRALGVLLIVIGIALLIVGLLYFSVAADKLPSILGRMPHATGHRTKRAVAAVAAGGVVVVGGVVALVLSRRR